MDLRNDRLFWVRWGFTPRLTMAWAGGAATVGAVVAGLTFWAQSIGDGVAGRGGYSHESLAGHAGVSVAVAVLAVAVAVRLLRQGDAVNAGVVLVATAVGPLILVAVPVTETMLGLDGTAPPGMLPWRLTVAGMLVVLMGGWTAAVVRAMPAGDASARARDARAWFVLENFVGGALVAAAAGTYLLGAAQGTEQEPQLVPVAGWSVLAAGLVVATVRGGAASTRVLVPLAVAPVLLVAAVYRRPGGWPGVAGWEMSTSPYMMSTAIAVIVIGAPLLGATLSLAPVARLRAALRTGPEIAH